MILLNQQKTCFLGSLKGSLTDRNDMFEAPKSRLLNLEHVVVFDCFADVASYHVSIVVYGKVRVLLAYSVYYSEVLINSYYYSYCRYCAYYFVLKYKNVLPHQ